MGRDTVFKHLETVHSTGDKSVLLRQREILDLCAKQEMSVDDLAEHFGMNYFTIRNNLKELEMLGVIQVSPRKDGRKTLYRTTWEIIKQGEDAELIIFNKANNSYVNYSEVMKGFLENQKTVTRRFAEIVECLVAFKVDRMREVEGKISYGPDYRRALQGRAATHFSTLTNLVDILEQFVVSPVWDEAEGHEMFKLPVEREDAETMHERFYVAFVNEGLLSD